MGTLFTGGVLIKLTVLSPRRDCWRVRGIGVAVRVSTSTDFFIFKSLFFCATPKRCSSSIINNPSLFFGMDPPKILCVPINISTRLLTIFSIIVFCFFCDMKRDNILIVTPNFSNLFLNKIKCWLANIVVGTTIITKTPEKAAFAAARRAVSVLPKPTSPIIKRSISPGEFMSLYMSCIAADWSPVSLYGKLSTSSFSR